MIYDHHHLQFTRLIGEVALGHGALGLMPQQKAA